jgi:hypothetical protein
MAGGASHTPLINLDQARGASDGGHESWYPGAAGERRVPRHLSGQGRLGIEILQARELFWAGESAQGVDAWGMGDTSVWVWPA